MTPVVAPTTFLDVTALTGGNSYAFKINAVNKYGNGVVSPTAVTIKAGQAPKVHSAADTNLPTTAVPSNSVYVQISWVAPTTNNFAIDKYQIQIKKSDGTYYEDLTFCDGSVATVISNLYCLVPMATLRAAPYNLVFGNSILARVQSHNARGWSGYSADSTTFATVQTEPVQMT